MRVEYLHQKIQDGGRWEQWEASPSVLSKNVYRITWLAEKQEAKYTSTIIQYNPSLMIPLIDYEAPIMASEVPRFSTIVPSNIKAKCQVISLFIIVTSTQHTRQSFI